MIRRRRTLQEALSELQAGELTGVTAIVVSREWWDALTAGAQGYFQRQCQRFAVILRVDDALTRHYVELASDRDEPPLSTERRV